VGFWGCLVAARRAAASGSTDDWLALTGLGQLINQQYFTDGWLLAHTTGQGEDLSGAARRAAAAINGPVIAAFVLDSDCAILTAAGAHGETVNAVLNAQTAVDSYDMPEPDEQPNQTAQHLAAWARGQNLTPDIQHLQHTLTETTDIVEDSFTDLLTALGIPAGS
jgi:hypothetical protein